MPFKPRLLIRGVWRQSRHVFADRREVDRAVGVLTQINYDVEQVIVIETDDPPTHSCDGHSVYVLYSPGAAEERRKAHKLAEEQRRLEAIQAAAEERQRKGPWYDWHKRGEPEIEERDLGVFSDDGRRIGLRVVRKRGEFVESPGGGWPAAECTPGEAVALDAHWTLDGRKTSACFYDRDTAEVCEQGLANAVAERLERIAIKEKRKADKQRPKLYELLAGLAGITADPEAAELIRRASQALSGKKEGS